MSDRLCAYLILGGQLPRAKLPQLLKAITAADVSLEWGDCCFRPASEKELLNVRQNGEIFLCDEEARNGEFEELEQACRRLGVAYTRFTEGASGYDPELVDWRPGMKKSVVRHASNCSEAIYVPVKQVEKALRYLEAGQIHKANQTLRALCPEVLKLPPFKIV